MITFWEDGCIFLQVACNMSALGFSWHLVPWECSHEEWIQRSKEPMDSLCGWFRKKKKTAVKMTHKNFHAPPYRPAAHLCIQSFYTSTRTLPYAVCKCACVCEYRLQYCSPSDSWTHCRFLSVNVLNTSREGDKKESQCVRERALIYSVEQQEVESVKVNNFKVYLLMQQLHSLIFIILQTLVVESKPSNCRPLS